MVVKLRGINSNYLKKVMMELEKISSRDSEVFAFLVKILEILNGRRKCAALPTSPKIIFLEIAWSDSALFLHTTN